MIPRQAVTIVSSGGTMMQLCDQRGAPYPTTGYGALVFNTGPHLIDPIIENPTILGIIEGVAPIESPIFIGDPQVPTPPVGDDDSSIPNTEWVNDAIEVAVDDAIDEVITTVTGDFVKKTGDTMTGALTVSAGNIIASGGRIEVNRVGDAAQADLYVTADAGFNTGLSFLSGATLRWLMRKNSTAEGGANAGSDLELIARDDAGAALNTVLTAKRSTGFVGLNMSAVSALARLHLRGAGQTSPSVDTATAAGLGSTLYVQDQLTATVGSGGMVMFGAGNGAFATIKGHALSGTSNTAGDLVVSTRRVNTDATLTETVRFKYDGSTVLAGALTGTTATFSGNTTAAGSIVTGAAGVYRSFFLQTTGSTRWALSENNAAEAGSDAGSDFNIISYTDAGAFKAIPFAITRSTGAVALSGALTGTTATMSGNIITNGGYMMVDRTGDATPAYQYFRSDAGQAAIISIQTGTSQRWTLSKNSVAESGSNAGSNIELYAYDDTGAVIAGGPALAVTRATKAVALTGALTGTTATFSGNVTIAQTANGGFVANATDASANRPLLALQKQGVTRLQISCDGTSPGATYYEALGASALHQFFAGGSAQFTVTPTTATFASIPTHPTPTAGDNTTKSATTAFVTAALAGGGASISVGTTPPGSPAANALWWNTDASVGGGQMYIYYDSFWVPASPGVGSGAVVQTVSFQTGAVATGTTVIPFDDTIPQITEGNEYMTCSITPKSATSKLIIDVTWFGSTGSAAETGMAAALFQDSTANALAMGWTFFGSVAKTVSVKFNHTMISGTTSPTTFRVRAGAAVSGTTTFNGSGGVRFFGGALASSIVIQEVL